MGAEGVGEEGEEGEGVGGVAEVAGGRLGHEETKVEPAEVEGGGESKVVVEKGEFKDETGAVVESEIELRHPLGSIKKKNNT